jgi:hypothetical protein
MILFYQGTAYPIVEEQLLALIVDTGFIILKSRIIRKKIYRSE